MAWEFENDRPIYTQLLEMIQMMIIAGRYRSGDKIPPVRELSVEAGVNPNTMQRALQELERLGLLCVNRTAGRTVTEDTALIEKIREQKALDYTGRYLLDMRRLGYDRQAVMTLLHSEMEKADGGSRL